MSLLEMQRALCRILTERECLDLFLHDQAAALSLFDLTAAEKTAISGINAKRLREYSEILVVNRLDLTLKVLPHVHRILGRDFARSQHALEYVRRHPPTPSTHQSPVLTELKTLVPFLETLALGGALGAPYITDFLYYDVALFLTGSDPSIEARVGEFESQCHFFPDADGWDERIPLLSPGARMEDFTVDITQFPAFQEAQLQRRPTIVLFYKSRGDSAVRVTKINSATKRFLELCDGRSSLVLLARQIAKESSIEITGAIVKSCVVLCRSLSRRRVVGALRLQKELM